MAKFGPFGGDCVQKRWMEACFSGWRGGKGARKAKRSELLPLLSHTLKLGPVCHCMCAHVSIIKGECRVYWV